VAAIHQWFERTEEAALFAVFPKGEYSEPFRPLIPIDSAPLFRLMAPPDSD